MNLDEILHERVVGQHEGSYCRGDAVHAPHGLNDSNRPVAYHFLGPRIGNNELSKGFGEALLMTKRAFRLDISE